jgi:SAM-dependent methyltransferase
MTAMAAVIDIKVQPRRSVSMIYDYPQYYEIAFSFRNIPRETAFLQECMGRFSRIEIRRIFEVACGFAPHAEELVKRGYRYLGLDNNRNMLDYAVDKWRHLQPRPEFLEGDMVCFKTPCKVDFAFVMLGSLYLNTVKELNSHFDSMAQTLNPGGLYFLDWCVQFDDPMKYAENNSVTWERDGVTVKSCFNIRVVDPGEQMYEEVWTLDVTDRGRRRNLQMTERTRAIFPHDFLNLVKSRPDFEFVGWWKEWDLNQPVDSDSEVTRPIVLLRRV